MSEVFLGVIAVAVTVMAIIQVAAIVFATRAARRVGDVVDRLEQDVKPIVANLQSVSSDAARATTLAAAQVERIDLALTGLIARIDELLRLLRETMARPAREGAVWLRVLKAAFEAFRRGDSAKRKRPGAAEDDDAMFIG